MANILSVDAFSDQGVRKQSAFHPGAAPYGNFINYYSFNPPLNRLALIPRDLLGQILSERETTKQDVTVLDVGCNSGDLTISLYEHLAGIKCRQTIDGGPDQGAGIEESCTMFKKSNSSEERDGFCCKKCIQKEQTLCPQCNSSLSSKSPQSETEENAHTQTRQIYMFGCDIDNVLIERANETNLYHNNIVFKEADVMNKDNFNKLVASFLQDHTSQVFDLTTCFSITMWIHLHHGDQGLLEFLQEVSKRTRYLIIEPQPWKCYKSAVRRVKKLGQSMRWCSFDEFQIRENVVEQIEKHLVTECGMEIVQCLGKTEWERSLLMLKNCNHV